jgi:hypothetical protein
MPPHEVAFFMICWRAEDSEPSALDTLGAVIDQLFWR